MMEPYLILSILLFGASAAAFPIKKKEKPIDEPVQDFKPEIIGIPIRYKGLTDYDTMKADITASSDQYLKNNVSIRINGMPALGRDDVSKYRAQSIRLQAESCLARARIISILNVRPDSARFGLIADVFVDNQNLTGFVYDIEPMDPAGNMTFRPDDNGRYVRDL